MKKLPLTSLDHQSATFDLDESGYVKEKYQKRRYTVSLTAQHWAEMGRPTELLITIENVGIGE